MTKRLLQHNFRHYDNEIGAPADCHLVLPDRIGATDEILFKWSYMRIRN